MLKVPRREIMAGERSFDINIPLDITEEILKKLPAKSIARFRCVSKGWESMIIVDSIVTRSLTQPPRDPHFLFVEDSLIKPVERYMFHMDMSYKKTYVRLSAFYAYPHQIKNKEQQIIYHGDIFGDCTSSERNFAYVRGLIGWCSPPYGKFKIHNPTTNQSVSLPSTEYGSLRKTQPVFYLFGYDPWGDEYKVVCLTKHKTFCQVFTLGNQKKLWTTILCGIELHFPFGDPVCINGVVYYKANLEKQGFVLVSFDVRSEKFYLVQAPEKEQVDQLPDFTLVNYQGKLGCISRNKLNGNDVDMWVMENDEKQEWSKVTFVAMLQDLPKHITFEGVTHPGGEIILLHQIDRKKLTLDVYYYDPKQNSRRRVEIQTTITSSERISLTGFFIVSTVTDHVENIMRL